MDSVVSLDLNTLAIIVTLAVQTGGWVWWASSITTRIKHLESQNLNNENLGVRMASLEASLKALSITIDRIYKEVQNKADKP